MNGKAKKIKNKRNRPKKKIQTSKKFIAFVFAFARCEWVLRSRSNEPVVMVKATSAMNWISEIPAHVAFTLGDRKH